MYKVYSSSDEPVRYLLLMSLVYTPITFCTVSEKFSSYKVYGSSDEPR